MNLKRFVYVVVSETVGPILYMIAAAPHAKAFDDIIGDIELHLLFEALLRLPFHSHQHQPA